MTCVEKKLINFQTNSDLIEKARIVFKREHMTTSQALNLFLKNVVIQNEIPLLTEEELEKEKIFQQLQAEVQKSINDIQSGNYFTEEEMRKELGIN